VLLANFDIFSDGLGRSFHGFGGNRQTRQELHLLHRKLAVMAALTQVIRA
jgi:hypothetical protein